MPDEWRYHVYVAQLPGDLPPIHEVRYQVFILEQGIPAHLEWDGEDAVSQHVIATDCQQVTIGTGRLDPRGRIGRMAVLSCWRSRGVGRDLLAKLLGLARAQGHREAVVHAQCAVADFYRKAGFQQQEQPFLEAGIEHMKMVKTLVCGNNENNR